jgi:hypothetical protein
MTPFDLSRQRSRKASRQRGRPAISGRPSYSCGARKGGATDRAFPGADGFGVRGVAPLPAQAPPAAAEGAPGEIRVLSIEGVINPVSARDLIREIGSAEVEAAMTRQMSSERDRRATVIRAQGEREAIIREAVFAESSFPLVAAPVQERE